MTVENKQPFYSNGLSDKDAYADDTLSAGNDKIYQNYLLPNLELYDAKVSINHWQLRDCIKSSSVEKGKLFYIFDHSIRELNTIIPPSATDAESNVNPSHEVVTFNFKPSCFTESNGLIACGGLLGSNEKEMFPIYNYGSAASTRHGDNESSEGTDPSSAPAPIIPIPMANGDALNDNSNYSNPKLWKGVLSIHDKNTNKSNTFILGQFINNCVALQPKSTNDFKLFACNNDNHLYECDISNSKIVLNKRYNELKFALNNIAISSDANSMIVSGDSNEFAIYHKNLLTDKFTISNPTLDPNPMRLSKFDSNYSEYLDYSGNSYSNIYHVPNADHGFYSSFSENNLQFATIFQNGTCLLYDLRKMDKPLFQINSSRQYSQNGAFRVCKFSKGIDDLLFITEHQSRIHVIDTRNFANHQVILVPEKLKSDPEFLTNSNLSTTESSTNSSSATINEENNALSRFRIQRRSHDSRRRVSNISRGNYSLLFTASNNNNNNNNRRYSYPPTTKKRKEPWVTSANIIPIKFLEPRVVPYPNAASLLNRYSNNFDFNVTPTDNRFDSIPFLPTVPDNQRNLNFNVRRVSTSMNDSFQSNKTDQFYKLKLDENRNDTIQISDEPNEQSSIENNLTDLENDVEMDFSSTDFTEETNISGLDWVEDFDGSSIVIGSHYGVIKWGINSWARRSFSSYDFC